MSSESENRFATAITLLEGMIEVGRIGFACAKIAKAYYVAKTEGERLLQEATPKDTGATAEAWHVNASTDKNTHDIVFSNDHTVNGFNVASGLRFGHGIKGGGFVPGRDYTSEPLRKINRQLNETIAEEISKL